MDTILFERDDTAAKVAGGVPDAAGSIKTELQTGDDRTRHSTSSEAAADWDSFLFI